MDENEKQPIKAETTDNPQQTIQDGSVVEDAILQKLPNDPVKQQLFLNTFKNEDISKTFTQQDIIGYIQQTNLSRFGNILKTKLPEEQTKLIMEDIDLYFQSVNGSVKEVISYNNTLDENVNSTNETNESTQEAIAQGKLFLQTKESYEKLDEKYKTQLTEENKKTIPKYITDNIEDKIQRINEAVPGSNFQADDYLKFYLTARDHSDELKDNPFLTDFKALNESFFPENTTFANMEKPKETDTVVNINPDLSKYVDTSPRLDKIATPPLPEIKDLDQEFEMYVKFIPDQDIREHVMKNQKIILAYKKSVDEKKTPDEKDKAAYEEYLAAISTVKESLPQSTQTMLKQRVMGSCISGLVRYFDTTTINEDNFADDFTLKTNTEGFSIGKGEKQYNEQGDDILCINGNIKGNTIGFYYNLNNPDAQLKSEDYLHYNKENNEFAFGVKGGGKRELGVKLPTISMLSEQAQLVSEKYFAELLETSGNREELSNALKQKVSERLLQNYTQEALIKSRVERDVEKNITTQTLHHDFIPDTVLARLNEDSNINSVSEKQARELMQIRDKSTEHMRSDQLRTLRNIMTRLDPIRKQELPRLEAKRETLFADMKKEGTAVTASLTFWQRFSKNGEIQVQDLETFVTSLEKKESIGSNIHKFSPEFQTAEEQGNADALLNADIW